MTLIVQTFDRLAQIRGPVLAGPAHASSYGEFFSLHLLAAKIAATILTSAGSIARSV